MIAEESGSHQLENTQFKKSSLVYGALAALPFCLIIFLDLLAFLGIALFHFWFFIVLYFLIWIAGAIGMIIIAFAEVRLVWKHFGGKLPDKKLNLISLAVFLLSFFTAALFVLFAWINLVLLPHW